MENIEIKDTLTITGGDYVDLGMGLIYGTALVGGMIGSGGFLGLALFGGAVLLAYEEL